MPGFSSQSNTIINGLSGQGRAPQSGGPYVPLSSRAHVGNDKALLPNIQDFKGNYMHSSPLVTSVIVHGENEVKVTYKTGLVKIWKIVQQTGSNCVQLCFGGFPFYTLEPGSMLGVLTWRKFDNPAVRVTWTRVVKALQPNIK